jgi:hypothetical protein
MSKLSQTPWIAQGILSITMTPNLGRYSVPTKSITGPLGPYIYEIMGKVQGTSYNLLNDWRNSPNLLNALPAKYRKLKKFFTAPYLMLELTTFNGAAITMRPESWNDPNAWISERVSLGAPNQRVAFMPVKYNAGRGSTIVEQEKDAFGNVVGYYDDNGDYLDMHTQVVNMPSFALVNNGYLSAMASQAHSLSFSRESADWSQQKALRANETSYDQATNALQTTAGNALTGRNADALSTRQANDYAWQQTGISAAQAIGNGISSGTPIGAGGGVVSAATGAIGTALDNNNRNAQWGIRNGANASVAGANQSSAEYMRDTNKGLADWASRGDYENTIAGINARVQDMRMIQPSMSGQAGGEVFNLVNGGVKLSLRFKMISYNAMCIIGDYWLRYGYAVNRFMSIDKLKVMTNFSYWKLSETYLIGTYLSEFHKQTIRGIFETGVTVWSDPSKMGFIDISNNNPLAGIVIPVDPDPANPIPTPEVPLVPNDDEEDEMYLINYAGSLYTLGKEYMADNATLQVTQGTSQLLIGVEPVTMTAAQFGQALRSLNIPDTYTDRNVFLTENPSGKWSAAIDNEAAMAEVGQSLTAALAKLDALNAKLPDPA